MKRSRALLLSIPVLVILLGLIIYQYVYVEIQTSVASVKENESIKTKTLEKYITLISEKTRLEKELAALKETRKDDDSKLVQGQTLSLAGASLQDIVKDIVTRSGGTISSERVGKPEDMGKFKVIIVSIDTVLPDTRTLRDILYSIETRTPYLAVRDLDVRIRNYKEPRELIVKLDVSALTSSR